MEHLMTSSEELIKSLHQHQADRLNKLKRLILPTLIQQHVNNRSERKVRILRLHKSMEFFKTGIRIFDHEP